MYPPREDNPDEDYAAWMAWNHAAAQEHSKEGSTPRQVHHRRPWRRCASCWGICHWHDEAWVCRDCGDEWYPQPGTRYALTHESRHETSTPEGK